MPSPFTVALHSEASFGQFSDTMARLPILVRTVTHRAMQPFHILYGAPHSLYTGKTRAYLRKQGIPFVERTPGDESFRTRIVPAVGRGIIPVLELPDGRLLQDTADILDHFENAGVRTPARPPGTLQRVLAHAIELYAVVVLTRHAMHYRWSYLDEQRDFLSDAFAAGSDEASAAKVMARMHSYLPLLGVTRETIPAIEASYHSLLDILQAHFACHPYLLGGQPSVGDYGLLGPMFAHLGRDPVPADIMKRRAPKVFRWIERMNAPDEDIPEYEDYPARYLPDDEIPQSLRPLLQHMADELFPELTDQLAGVRRFVEEAGPIEGTPVTDKPHKRIIATAATSFRGVPFTCGIQPYMLYLWQRVTDPTDGLGSTDQGRVHGYLASVGLTPLLEAHRVILVERRSHLEVWGRRLARPVVGCT